MIRRKIALRGGAVATHRYLRLMVVGTGVLLAITFIAGWDYGILVTEALLIVLFAVFWLIQTIERWNVTAAE